MIDASVGVFLAVLGLGVESAEPIVRWDAPSECGTASELRDRVARQVGTLEADIEIVGRVRREHELYALELELVVGGERRRRSFSAVDCSTLLDAAALVSSAALGPDAAREELPGGEAGAVPEPVGEPADVPEPATTAAVRETTVGSTPASKPTSEPPITARVEPAPGAATSRPRARSPRPGRWLLSARGGIGFDGTLAPPVGSLGFGRAWARWRVQALVDAFGGRARGPNGALDLRVVTITPRACATIRPRARLELSPCAGVAAGAAIGQGRDVLNPRTDAVPWIAAQLDFGVLAVPRPWLAVGLELSNYALLGRPRFALSDRETVFRAGSVGTRAMVTVELRFSATDSAGAGH